MNTTTLKEVPIRSTHAAFVEAKRRELEGYVARTRAHRDATFVRPYYRRARQPPPRAWADVAEMCALVPLGLVLAAFAIQTGFGS